MRTNEPRVIPSIQFLGCLSAVGVIGVALAACSSSTHLDPPGASATGTGGHAATTGTSTTATGPGSGGGGGAPTMACQSNPECSTFPNTVCDTISGECHECLLDSDCALKGGPVCVSGKCGCPVKGEAFCGAPGVGHCTDKMTAQADCKTCGHACFGACTAGACADPWEPTSLVGAPDARSRHVAVWDTDKTMIVWGGRTGGGSAATGGVYDPAKNTWKSTSMANAPTARVDATAVWDNTEKAMIVWGGRTALGGSALNTGALYYPAKNVWKTIALDVSTPAGRWGQSAVWTGSKMLVWGGENASGQLGDGGAFDPAVGTWSPIPVAANSPTPRTLHTAVWTGVTTNSMLVWGGYGPSPDPMMPPVFFTDGAVYGIQGAAWDPMNAGVLAPSPRGQATAVWTGMNMLVWGGTDGASYLGDGAKYASGAWSTISNNGPPSPRAGHSAAWMTTSLGTRMIVWGGMNTASYLNSGALLDEMSLGWSPALPTAPSARAHHSTVINGDLGSKMIIWGGDVGALNSGEVTGTGAIFDASAPM